MTAYEAQAGDELTADRVNHIARRAYGSFSVSVNAGVNINTDIVFPAGLFDAAPHVNITPGNGRLNTSISAITKDGATVGATNFTTGNTGPTIIYWESFEVT